MVVVQDAFSGLHPYTIIESISGGSAPVWYYGFIWTGQEHMYVRESTYYGSDLFQITVSFDSDDFSFTGQLISGEGEVYALNTEGMNYQYFAIGY
jgi:hypothetical protein